jgi:hypothetical protein
MKRTSSFLALSLAGLVAPAVIAVACGGTNNGSSTGSGGSGASGTGTGASTGGDDTIGIGGGGDHGMIDSLTVDPPSATITVEAGMAGKQQFNAIAHYKDGFTQQVQAAWSATGLSVGSIDGAGQFSATGAQGGTLKVTATSNGLKATADLTVKLHQLQNPGNVDPGSQGTLKGASTPDGSVVWAYPYDKTVFPRGIGAPPLMWMNGQAQDAYYVHMTSATYELEVFAANLNSRFDLDAAIWDQLANSTSGDVEVKVSRLAGGAATVVVDQHWSIAPAQMRGTIYYWAINTGRVMRIKPGAAQAEDFLAGTTCPSCHTVSANGAKLVMNEGNWPNETSITYDLLGNANAFSGYATGAGASQFALAGVSADGKVVVQNFAPLRGPIGAQPGALDAVTGMPIAGTGLDGAQLWMPSFSPDNKLLAYVDGNTKDVRAYDWDAGSMKATNDRLIMAAGGDPSKSWVSFPTVSPDHNWIIYQRSSDMGSLGNLADLYMASVAQPGTEIALDALNGTNYPFAAGDRDRHYDFEPTFAPVAAGGYFWVVFHSRRTFGNALTGPAYSGEGQGTKQLWVAAIDENPKPGQDPSHPAFHLPGQDEGTLNMRGYWALDPCKGDGVGCAVGTECCGGYCSDPGDGGMPTCKSSSSGCSNNGDHCDTDADCCEAASGATCINHVCDNGPK